MGFWGYQFFGLFCVIILDVVILCVTHGKASWIAWLLGVIGDLFNQGMLAGLIVLTLVPFLCNALGWVIWNYLGGAWLWGHSIGYLWHLIFG